MEDKSAINLPPKKMKHILGGGNDIEEKASVDYGCEDCSLVFSCEETRSIHSLLHKPAEHHQSSLFDHHMDTAGILDTLTSHCPQCAQVTPKPYTTRSLRFFSVAYK